MKIKMLRTAKVSPNGYDIAVYAEGEIVDAPEALAASLVAEGVAEAEKAEEAPQNKAAKPSRNKGE